MERIIVSLGHCSYPITIDAGLLKNAISFWPLKEGDNAMLVTNQTLAHLYLKDLSVLLKNAGIKVDHLILPDGEQYKNLTMLDKIFTELLKKSHGRDTTLIAFGGGVIGDLTGFAAASYQRGVRFIQVPTTLLSQVDSSIGGKTSVNHVLGKNMIGAFYQPQSVIVDTDCLITLPQRELASGLAEVIKYAIIFNSKFFQWLETNIDLILTLKKEVIAHCIRRCCEIKARLVSADERENNVRVLLNLGHTFAHAIEVHMGYGSWLHGEAVAAGMVMAARTAEYLGIFTPAETNRISSLLQRAGLPVRGPASMNADAYIPHMMRDKKVLGGKLRLVLPLAIGYSKLHSDVNHDVVRAVIDCC